MTDPKVLEPQREKEKIRIQRHSRQTPEISGRQENFMVGRLNFNLHLKDPRGTAIQMLSGSSCHKAGSSNANLWLKCFFEAKI